MNNIGWPLVKNQIRRGLKHHTFGLFTQRKSGRHWGWDFYAPVGTPCYAIADGVIATKYGAVSDTDNFGVVVVLEFEHNNKTLFAAYCHLSSAAVKDGNAVKKGQLIGYTGNSGNARDMKGLDQHLHFELRTSKRPGPGGSPMRLDPIEIFKVCPMHAPVMEA